MRFYGYHGALPEERKLGQRFQVDVSLSLDLYRAGSSDSLDQTVDYGNVYRAIREIVEGKSCRLIETVAERIAENLLHDFPAVEVCGVRVTKPDPPIDGHYDSVSVEIERKRSVAYIGLGSNMNDREHLLRQALRALDGAKNVRVDRCSSIYETDPVGPVEQSDFLNMVVRVETLLPPAVLLGILQHIESDLHRKREIRWGPRTIDLDVLLYDQVKMDGEILTIPHPEIRRRPFVLKPLFEIAPHLVIPGLNQSVTELWQNLNEEEGVRLWIRNNGEGEFGLFEN